MNTILYKNLNDLPDVSAVYIVRDGEVVLYVGSSIRLRTRFRNHHKKEFFKSPSITIEYIECDIHWLGPLEVQKIKELKPTLNSVANKRTLQKEKNLTGKSWYPFGDNDTTSFRDKTIQLLNMQHEKSLKEIAKELDLKYEWLCSFSRGKSVNPGVNTVQKLYEYLTSSKLSV